MSHPNIIEHQLAYELIVQATDRLEPLLRPDDLEAGIVASLATALQIASKRQLKEMHEIYQTNAIWLAKKNPVLVYSNRKSNHELFCCS